MNCGNNSCSNRMNRCEMQRPKSECVKPVCERQRPDCGSERPMRGRESLGGGCERPRRERERSGCGCEMSGREYTRPRTSYEMPRCETEKPSCGSEMPRCEVMKPSCGCEQENEMVENIFIINDCSCHEFMRVYDWYNCVVDKAHREFMEAEKNLKDAMECITMGLNYNEKAKEIGMYIDDFLDSMKESDSCDNQPSSCLARNTSNPTCNNSCTQMCTASKCNPCMQMRAELHEMLATVNEMEMDSLEHTNEALDKLMAAKQLHNCLNELKSKIAKNCYPRC